MAVKSFDVSGAAKVEEIIRILCENNRMAFLNHLKQNKKLVWLCQLCGVSLNRRFFKNRPCLFELREEENFGGGGTDCFLILRSHPAQKRFNQRHIKGASSKKSQKKSGSRQHSSSKPQSHTSGRESHVTWNLGQSQTST